MLAGLLWGAARDLQAFGIVGLGRETDWPCVVSIAVGTTVLWGVAGAMLRRGAVLEPRVTSVLAGVAAVSVANVEACISRVHAFTATVIVWHGITVAVLMLALVLVGPRLLGQRRRFASEGRIGWLADAEALDAALPRRDARYRAPPPPARRAPPARRQYTPVRRYGT
jgi:hypothetical protein